MTFDDAPWISRASVSAAPAAASPLFHQTVGLIAERLGARSLLFENLA